MVQYGHIKTGKMPSIRGGAGHSLVVFRIKYSCFDVGLELMRPRQSILFQLLSLWYLFMDVWEAINYLYEIWYFLLTLKLLEIKKMYLFCMHIFFHVEESSVLKNKTM